jgi:hypothetical protein
MSPESLKATCLKKTHEVEGIIAILEEGGKVNPGARIHEARFLKTWLAGLSTGKWNLDRIMKGLAALPVAVGRVNVLNNALGVHLGVLETHYEVEEADGSRGYYPILGVKKNPLDKAEPWVDYYDLMEKLNDAPERHGWRTKETGANGFANVRCPGWAIVSTTSGDVVDYHTCTTEFLSSEGWHGWRCPSCKSVMDTVRNAARSRGTAEKSVQHLTNMFLKGGVKRIRPKS